MFVIVLDIIMDRLSDSIRAVGESDFLALIRVPRSTLKNWDTAVALGLSATGAYNEADVVTGICFAQLVSSLALKQAGQVWAAHGAAIKQGCLLLPLEEGKETLDLILDTYTLGPAWRTTPRRSLSKSASTCPFRVPSSYSPSQSWLERRAGLTGREQ
jgi:hypothetical protein